MSYRRPRGRRVCARPVAFAIASAAAAAAVSVPSARAAGTFAVTTSADGGLGSLRQAILDANAAGGGTINVAGGASIVLNSPLPVLATPITINGNGGQVSGNNAHRVFAV